MTDAPKVVNLPENVVDITYGVWIANVVELAERGSATNGASQFIYMQIYCLIFNLVFLNPHRFLVKLLLYCPLFWMTCSNPYR